MKGFDKHRALTLGILAFAVIGFLPFANPGCGPPQIVDVETGQLRSMTQDEAAAAVDKAAETAKVAVVAAGHPEWIGIVDLLSRLGALVVAWTIRPKGGEQKQP